MTEEELLEQVPEFVKNDFKVPVMEGDEVAKRDLIAIIDMIFDSSIPTDKRFSLITKTELAVRKMATVFEKKYKEVQRKFRLWKAAKMEKLSRSDDKNPLIKGNYEKITESVKKNYLRNEYDEYAKYREKIDKYRNYKNLMWNVKDCFVNLSKNFSNINSIEEGE